jgi:LysR family transcriptional activator of nhaA
MYKINFNHLYYFLTIANEGSIVRASKVLNITQPALSHQLKLLEQDLGKKLFNRVGRRLEINKDGESVKLYATNIFRQSEEMLEFLKSNTQSFIKIIKIGTVSWISRDEIYEFIRPFLLSKHIKIQIFQKDLDILLKDISDKKLDIILCDSPYTGRSKKLQGHLLTMNNIVCVTSNPEIKPKSFPQCLRNKKLINYSSNCQIKDLVDNFLSENNIPVLEVGEFTDATLIKTALENNKNLIGFLPRTVIKNSIKAKTLYKIGTIEKTHFSIWAITSRDYKKNGVISKFIKNYKNRK